MTPLEIVLTLIGVGIIIISGFLVEKSGNTNTLTSENSNNSTVDLDTEEIKGKINAIITEVTEEKVTNTEDELSKISNEKIIAVNDYSNQVLDKIARNHEEVVFLYNMLNEKQNEVKELLCQMDNTKTDMYEKKVESLPKSNKVPVDTNDGILENWNLENKTVNNDSDSTAENNNKVILDLYKQGKSILEISKMLEIGQGEVKLVIDLFK
ncbi:MAG: hypothetical protein K0R92_28 [Lachnospiraceae bacterium]|jgi:hypothetical protein|nr:hypothetical protein [Lachnospiraceae bacterium]